MRRSFWLAALLATGACGAGSNEGQTESYAEHIEACHLLMPTTVTALAQNLPESTPARIEVTRINNFERTICKREFGRVPATRPPYDEFARPKAGEPAYRAIELDVQRFGALDGQTGEERARHWLKSWEQGEVVRDVGEVPARENAGVIYAIDRNVALVMRYHGENVNGTRNYSYEDERRPLRERLAKDVLGKLRERRAG